ncbi:MAG: hypothetical protein V1769_05170 [Thermoplasmatota archaeon]
MLAANNVVLYVTFLHAYFINNFTFSAHINQFGEAHIELIILGLSLLIGIYTIVHFLRTMTVENKQSSQ